MLHIADPLVKRLNGDRGRFGSGTRRRVLSQPGHGGRYGLTVTEGMITAHVDEAGAQLSDGRRLSVVAAVVTSSEDHPQITGALTALQEAELPLHYRTERLERRILVASVLAEAPLQGAILVTTSTSNTAQEQARSRLLAALLSPAGTRRAGPSGDLRDPRWRGPLRSADP